MTTTPQNAAPITLQPVAPELNLLNTQQDDAAPSCCGGACCSS